MKEKYPDKICETCYQLVYDHAEDCGVGLRVDLNELTSTVILMLGDIKRLQEALPSNNAPKLAGDNDAKSAKWQGKR